MTEIIIISLLLCLSAIFKGFMDTLVFHYEGSIWEKIEEKNEWLFFRIFDHPAKGGGAWRNKNRFQNKLVRLIMRTILVSFTDGWHLFQFISLSCWQLPLSSLLSIEYFSGFSWEVLGIFVVIKFLYGLNFELVWKRKVQKASST